MNYFESMIKSVENMKESLEHELFMICDRVHSNCDIDCPVYAMNGEAPGSDKPFEENRGCDCFKDGKKMYDFLKENTNG